MKQQRVDIQFLDFELSITRSDNAHHYDFDDQITLGNENVTQLVLKLRSE